MSIKDLFKNHLQQNRISKPEVLLNANSSNADTNTKQENQEEQEYEIVEIEILPEKMICPDCGGITLVGLDFCDKCGGELINHDN